MDIEEGNDNAGGGAVGDDEDWADLDELLQSSDEEEGGGGEVHCAICKLLMWEETCKLKPCNHKFHSKCLETWVLYQGRKCPYCRRQIGIISYL